jgi:hypothetical protein
MIDHKLVEKSKFEWKDLHKKVGRIIVQEPTDSDLQEGLRHTQVWFIDENMTAWLLVGKK